MALLASTLFKFKILKFLIAGLCVAFCLSALGIKSVDAESKPQKIKSIKLLEEANLPGIVSEADASRYRVIFDLQENGDWLAADKIIKILDNKILLGHVLAQRYLHPTKYRTKYKELKAWLAKYADHPQARRLYTLAIKRRPKNWKLPNKPVGSRYFGYSNKIKDLGFLVYNPKRKLSRSLRRERLDLSRKMRFYSRKGWTKAYKNLLTNKKLGRLFHPVELDRRKANLGAGYYADGRDKWAYKWSNAAVKRSGKFLPEAHWVAALSAWRLKKYELARDHFNAVAVSKYSSPWLLTAGAFWAARASIKIKNPRQYTKYLELASAYPRTFYGILARRLLGLEIKYNWAPPPLKKDALSLLAAKPGGLRAVSLLHIGKYRRAERELRMIFSNSNPELARAMMALADRANMPSLAMRIGNMLVASGSSLFDSTAYPAPALPVADQSLTDRALILALIRQESGFNPNAKSHRGARGLLQLMPRTASFVARDRNLRGSKKQRDILFDPEKNLLLGHKYIKLLLDEPIIKGDLFKLMIAWNGGPGNLNKWMRRIKYEDDPLLFIESIPSKETRIFVERVLANYWIYQARFDNMTPSLDLLAQGKWPMYQNDSNGLEIAEETK